MFIFNNIGQPCFTFPVRPRSTEESRFNLFLNLSICFRDSFTKDAPVATSKLPHWMPRALACLASLLGATAALGADAGDEMALFFSEGELLVSATKHTQTVGEAPAIANVITAEQIRRMGARDIMDVLRTIPGIGVTRAAYGVEEVEVRGIKTLYSEKMKFLIDGHTASPNANGGFAFAYDGLPLNNVKRIEIMRGPGSALHGSNAMAAVINVITNEARDTERDTISVAAASYQTYKADAQLSNIFDNGLAAALFVDAYKTDGARLTVESDALGNSGKTDDWDRRIDVGLNASLEEFTLHTRLSRRNRGPYIGGAYALNDESEIDTMAFLLELGHQYAVTDKARLTSKVYYDQFRWDAYWELYPEGTGPYAEGLVGNPYLKERTLGLELQWDHELSSDNRLTLGAVAENRRQYDVGQRTNFHPLTFAPAPPVQDVTAIGNWNRNEAREVQALYVQDVWQLRDGLDLTLGARHDRYSDFGHTTNPRAALVWGFREGWDAKLLYGTAFRAPTFTELYNQNNPSLWGNPDLQAEKMRTYELSLGHMSGEVRSRVSVFHNEFTDQITLGPSLVMPGFFQYENRGGATIDGLEAEAGYHFSRDSHVWINYTWQHPVDRDTGSRLPDVPTYKGNLGFNAALSHGLNLNLNVFAIGPRPRSGGDARPQAGGYALTDLTLLANGVRHGLDLSASVRNLFDKEYKDPAPANPGGTLKNDFPREGRTLWLELTYAL